MLIYVLSIIFPEGESPYHVEELLRFLGRIVDTDSHVKAIKDMQKIICKVIFK